MKLAVTAAIAALAGFVVVGQAEALPVAPATVAAPVVKVATIVTTRTVRPMNRVMTRRVVRRGPFGGRVVTTTRTVR